jgi:hypothetical protein
VAGRGSIALVQAIWWRCCLCAFVVVLMPVQYRAQRPDPSSAGQPDPGAQTSGDNSENRGLKLSGLALVVNVRSIDGDHVFQADGYRVRVDATTETAFSGSLKTLADVVPGSWIHFEGVLDQTGVLAARKAEFFPPGFRRVFTAMGPKNTKNTEDYQPITHDSLLDAGGHFVNPHTKVRLSDAGGSCGWHRVPADQQLQERVERIGMSIVPAYQKQLPPNDPSRIPFRFYAVADDKFRSVLACNLGLVLVPKNVVGRLQNDEQLAAVLADGVAFNLQRQLVTITLADGAGVSADVAGALVGGGLGLWATDVLVERTIGREVALRLERARARISLQLLADAGYDPWQAPEAWRLLAPNEAPKDLQALTYTREGKYQLSILNLQYKQVRPTP